MKRLEQAKIEPEKAEAIAEAVANVFENDLNDVLFTKHDVDLLKADIKESISQNKMDIITWAVGLIFAQTAILSVLKFLH